MIKKVRIFSACLLGAIVIALAIWFISVLMTAEQAVKFMTNFQKIHETKPPLSIAQVEQLMGPPLRIEHAESTGVIGDVYHYPTYPPGPDFQIVFVNGVVFRTAIPSPTKS